MIGNVDGPEVLEIFDEGAQERIIIKGQGENVRDDRYRSSESPAVRIAQNVGLIWMSILGELLG